MQLRYGAYPFLANGVKVSATSRLLYNAGNQPKSLLAGMAVEGFLLTISPFPQDDLSLQAGALATALAIPYQDLVLIQDDGLQSQTKLLNAGSITGVRIVEGPDWPKTDGPEYATLRSFTFKAEAEYPLPGSLALLESWTESVTTWGGDAEVAFRRSKTGPPQRQIVWLFTEGYCTQKGEIVGYRDYPPAPPPLFPDWLKEAGKVTRRSPKRMGRGYQDFAVEYEYQFVTDGLIIARPNLWP